MRPRGIALGGVAVAVLCAGLGACGSCSGREAGGDAGPGGSVRAAREILPRCRPASERVAIPGDDVVVGDAAVGPGGLLVGVIRTLDGGARVGSVLRASLDLANVRVFDVGTAFGDDPPPSPRWLGTTARVLYVTRSPSDAGPRRRELRILGLEEGGAGRLEATVLQQADESTDFDVAWDEEGAGLAAWDEDAPIAPDAGAPSAAPRGFVKVQPLREGARWRVASPESSDAESPRLLARPSGGFWLAWLARRAEEDAYSVEGPGERRAFRWVEVVPLSARGEPAGPVRRASSDKGRVASFELARRGSDLVVLVQDEDAPSEGAGARIVAHVVAERAETIEIVDGGVDQALADLVPIGSSPDEARWLAWTDTADHAHLLPLGAGLAAAGRATLEPALDGARVLAAAPPDALYALVGPSQPGAGEAATNAERPSAASPGRLPELRRFACVDVETRDD